MRQREVQELVTAVRELAQLLNRSGQGDAPELKKACATIATQEAPSTTETGMAE